MNFMEAIGQMVARPGILALAPPARILGFNPGRMLMMFDRGKEQYARLRQDDFLRMDWVCVTPDELAKLGEQMGGEGQG